MSDKTKSQTYNFLSENKSIEDIKKQANIEVKEKSRHGGKTFKIIEKPILSLAIDNSNNDPNSADENLEPIAISLTDNEKIQETNNYIWTKIKNYLNLPTANTEEISKLHTTIQEQAKEIQKLIKENEKLKLKQSNDNLAKFSYNAITIYDEKQRKKTGIEKIHEEILPIEDKIIFITTVVHDNQSITEEIIHFYKDNNEIEVIKQLKQYKNINKYKDYLSLIVPNTNHEKVIKIKPISIKDFLKKQYDFKLKPTKTEISIWSASWLVPITLIVIGLIHPPLLITTIVLSIVSLILKEVTELFSPISIKVKSWIKQKFYSIIRKIPKVNKRNLVKTKEEIEIKNDYKKTIENLTSDNLETKLKIQYNILKQELDNKKDKNPKELINYETINYNSNSIIKNSNIESENNQNFDLSIRNIVNQQELQPSTISANTWNKVKCLFQHN